jgi:L-cysteine:1D-myo-inositol 2-amino-2-deoxy-alpha-D-glucopyranoside ligase
MKSWSSPSIPVLPNSGSGVCTVQVHDTSTNELKAVGSGDDFSMYVCGITPYDATHMGHAATYVAFDLLNRVSRDAGRKVTYVQNVTNIDDPLLERAVATGVDWQHLAQRETQLFFDDMAALRVIAPDDYVSAVAEIPAMAERIAVLRDLGLVYQVDTDWYFRTNSQGHLGDVSHLDADRMRVIFAERGGDPDRVGKESPFDCLVWSSAREGQPSWDSALGVGRPGWHIGCTTMALNRLPSPFDVQGGGSDLFFPHHDMCNAQAYALSGNRLAEAFVHAGMIGLDGEKMSKSRGNLVLISHLRAAGVDPMAIRLALLAGHYRSDREWTQAGLDTAQARLTSWRASASCDMSAYLADIRSAMRQDLDTPTAIALIDGAVRDAHDALISDPIVASDASSDVTPSVTLADVVEALLGIQL